METKRAMRKRNNCWHKTYRNSKKNSKSSKSWNKFVMMNDKLVLPKFII